MYQTKWLKNITVPSLYLAGQIIDVSTDRKYLGMFLSDMRKDECGIKGR